MIGAGTCSFHGQMTRLNDGDAVLVGATVVGATVVDGGDVVVVVTTDDCVDAVDCAPLVVVGATASEP